MDILLELQLQQQLLIAIQKLVKRYEKAQMKIKR